MKKTFIIAITGPAGAGKSTVAASLAKQTEKSVNIDADHVKHFIMSGFIYDESPEGVAQWELLGENVAQLAKNYQSAGYNVIVNGYLNEPAWNIIETHIMFTDRFLLLPTLIKVQERDNSRSEDVKMGDEATRSHHDYFSNNKLYKSFTVIDSSDQTILQTVTMIKELI